MHSVGSNVLSKYKDSYINMVKKMALDADYAGFDLPSALKSDNRVIVLQKR